jgi:multidrug efflux pump subunit AcrB
MKRMIEFFASEGIFAQLTLVLAFILGLVVFYTIKREAFPNVEFDIITVSTPYPGASPDEAERLITNPLEQDMREVDGIDEMISVSTQSQSLLILKIDPDQTTTDEAKSDIQEVVDRFTDIPDDAEDPIVTSFESKQSPVLEISLAGNYSEMELREEAKKLEKELRNIPGVARVVFQGKRDLEILVEADPKKLAQYQVSLNQLIATLANQNVSIPGGTLDLKNGKHGKEEVIIRTVEDFKTADDVADTVIRANELAQPVKVKDLAKVTYTLEEAKQLQRTDGQPAISLTIVKKEKADTINLVRSIKDKLEDYKKGLTKDIQIATFNDMSYYIKRRLKVLTGNLAVGLLLVLIVLTLMLPGRIALITAIGIPFSFLGTLIVFQLMGISINLLTMMGLIIVIGMLVDDAVVVTENAQRYIDKGLAPLEAAIKGTHEVWLPITGSIFTTIAAFLPLMFMSGIMGKFVVNIPVAVIIALLISLFECFFVLPHHIAAWVKSKSQLKTHKESPFTKVHNFWDNKLVPAYVNTVKKAVTHRYITISLAMFFIIFTGVFAKYGMNYILFPEEGVEQFFVRAETPTGTNLESTLESMKVVEAKIAALPKTEVKNFATRIGIKSKGVDDPAARRGSEYAQIEVFLTPEDDRERTARDMINALREDTKNTPGLESLNFSLVQPGPPVGSPISMGVRADKYEDILPVVEQIKKDLATQEGVSDIEENYVLGKKEYWIEIDSAEAKAAGLDAQTIGTTVRAAYEGIEATSIRTLDEEIDVRVSLSHADRDSMEALNNVQISNANGFLVSLSRIATIKEERGIAAYIHQDNLRQVEVTGDVDKDVNTPDNVSEYLKSRIPEYKKISPNVTFHFGGERKESAESMQSLLFAALVALLLIISILILTFRDIIQPFIVIMTIPIGAASAAWTFYFHQWPLTFLGMLGVIALSGVIVNNAIVFTVFVNNFRKSGLSKFDSLIETARTRIRPIFLTTVTTSAGILPTAYGIGGLDKFVVPVALALGWGILFGSMFTSLTVPASLAVLDDVEDFFKDLLNRSKTAK